MNDFEGGIQVYIIADSEKKWDRDREVLAQYREFDVRAIPPEKLVASLDSISSSSVLVFELPFDEGYEDELLDLLSAADSKLPVVLVTDDPVRYIKRMDNGLIRIVFREFGYWDYLSASIKSARRTSEMISEKEMLQKRLREYVEYLETINKIMEHDIGDLNQAILTFAELLRHSAKSVTQDVLDSIIKQSRTVGNLIDSFAELARLAKGNTEDMLIRPMPLKDAVMQGVAHSISTGMNMQADLRGDFSVPADAHLPELFEHASSYVIGINGIKTLYVGISEGLALRKSARITISATPPEQGTMPTTLSHMEDINTLLRGNVDIMAMIMLCRRYGGSASICNSGKGGEKSTSITIMLPLN